MKGYIKSPITEGPIKNNVVTGIGSVTDGQFKMEVRVDKFVNDTKVERGHEVQLIGTMYCNRFPFYILLDSMDTLTETDGNKMLPSQLLKGFRIPPKKRSAQDDNSFSKVTFLFITI